MKKLNKFSLIVLFLAILVGCSQNVGLDNNGHFKGIKALNYVELFDYKNIKIPSEVLEVTDSDIESEIDTILNFFSETEEVKNRNVKTGDTVNIDYVGSVDGVEFENGSTNGLGSDVIIGTTNFIDDFLEQLIGHKPGETIDVEVTFPSDYHETSLSGKDALFVTTINYIVEAKTPELNDTFVVENLASYYGWKTVSEMRAGIKENLKERALENYVLQLIQTEATVESVPDSVLSHIENEMISTYEEKAKEENKTLDEYLEYYFEINGVDELKEMQLSNNTLYAKYLLTIQALAEDMSLEVTDEDISLFFQTNYNTDDYSDYVEKYGLPYIKQTILAELVIVSLRDNIKNS